MFCVFFFFKQKTAYEIKECDWSSDVCSSDLKIITDAGLETVYTDDIKKYEWEKTILNSALSPV